MYDVCIMSQASKLLGSRISGTPKNGDGDPNLGAGFLTRNPGIVRLMDNLIVGFSERKPEKLPGNSPNSEAGFPNGNPNFNCNF